ncbi:hypothetical protein EIP91_005981 [Steccherinum ochraceum]|uniref:Uncharacterized protein n=1 Tax=Steccherinum ochraceum TaxID=92696 RepID=A0A4R0RES9_9APHY|nr:hypothetical protein EIP91_005981 [Steccherinum ochraceum]
MASILDALSSEHLQVLSLSYPFLMAPSPPLTLLPTIYASSAPPTLPNLHDLTIHAPLLPAAFPRTPRTSAPCLRRLALSGYIQLPPALGIELQRLFPILEELRIELRHGSGNERVVMTLCRQFCRRSDEDDLAAQRERDFLPETLRVLTVALAPLAAHGNDAATRVRAYAHYLDSYVILADEVNADAEVDVRVEICRFPTDATRVTNWNRIQSYGDWWTRTFRRFINGGIGEEGLNTLDLSRNDIGVKQDGSGGEKKKKKRLVVKPGPPVRSWDEMEDAQDMVRMEKVSTWEERRKAVLG